MGFGQEMDGCGKCMKYSLFVANFLIMIGGIVVLSVGVYTVVDKAFMEKLLGTNLYMSSAYILIATGVLVVFIAFLGCLGAVKEIKCMLLTYFVVLLLLFVVMLVGGILGYVYRGQVQDSMRNEMQGSLKFYKGDSKENKLVKSAWDNTQTILQCCGVESYRDWETAINEVPQSCCNKTASDCKESPTPPALLYNVGCLTKGVEFTKQHAAIIGAVGVAVACLMILGMIFSCALFKMIE